MGYSKLGFLTFSFREGLAEKAWATIFNALKREKRGCRRGIALCNDEKGDLNDIVSLFVERTFIIYSNSIR